MTEERAKRKNNSSFFFFFFSSFCCCCCFSSFHNSNGMLLLLLFLLCRKAVAIVVALMAAVEPGKIEIGLAVILCNSPSWFCCVFHMKKVYMCVCVYHSFLFLAEMRKKEHFLRMKIVKAKRISGDGDGGGGGFFMFTTVNRNDKYSHLIEFSFPFS